MSYLATLEQAKREAKTSSDQDGSYAYLTQALMFVSDRIEAMRGYFEPRRETVYFDACLDPVSPDGRTLTLSQPLVELYGVTLGDGTAMSLDDIRLNPRAQTPVRELIIANQSNSFLDWTDIAEQSIAVTGAWCYRTEYAREAWSTASTLSAGINTAVTTITPASVAPFSVGHLLKIDSEYLRVTAVAASTLTVERGVNGTIAAAHDSADVIYTFVPQPIITRAALRWASFLLARRAAFEVVSFDGQATTNFPPDAPQEVMNIVRQIPLNRVAFAGV